MQQFARILTDKGVVPVILQGDRHLDLRPIVSDITPDTIAGGFFGSGGARAFQFATRLEF